MIKGKKHQIVTREKRIFFEKERRETDLNFKVVCKFSRRTRQAFKSQKLRKKIKILIYLAVLNRFSEYGVFTKFW